MKGPATEKCQQCGGTAALLFLARDLNRAVTQQEFPYYRCRACGVVHLSPAPDDPERFYPPGYYKVPRSEAELLEGEEHERFKLEAIGAQGSGRRLLEIGPSYGRFAALAKRAGFQVHGIELDPGCCSFLEKTLGIRVWQSGDVRRTLATLPRFDVIALWHSIEHLPDPWALLDDLPEHIEAGGQLAIASPNPQSLQFRLFGRDWVHLDAPRHVNLIPHGVLDARLSRRGMRRGHFSTADQGAADCNMLGWVTWSRRRLPGWAQHRPFSSIGWRVRQRLMQFERRGIRGSAYTAVYRKD
jgi:2-polyprenyl-3-methyl-5-hydroxy-6-metoxy-1,4-benzoquinol methylase